MTLRQDHRAAGSPASLCAPWTAAFGLLVAGGVLLRVVDLGHLPGVNGDEAWYGVQMQRLAAGEPVDWRTPTGNLMGPLQAGPLLLLQLAFPPSIALLRWPAVLSGLAMIALAGLVLGRRFGGTTGWIATSLAAALPVAIAYSRFGWDASHSGALALVALQAALATRVVGVALLFLLLLWVHPTNVFLAPFLIFAMLGAARERWGLRRVLPRAAVLVALLAAGTTVLRFTTSGASPAPAAAEVLGRALSGAEWTSFARHLTRFVTGDATHAYVVGSAFSPWPTGADLAAAGALVAAAAFALALTVREGLSATTGMAVGLAVALAGFGVGVGSWGLAPHTERYGLWLVAPLVSVMAVLAGRAAAERARPVVLGASAVAALLLLLHAQQGYLGALRETGSRSHPTFWSGPQEPKALAVRAILRDARGRRPLRIVADSWWTLWPARYLTHGEADVKVVPFEEPLGAAAGGVTYLLGFPDGEFEGWGAGRAFDVPGTGRPAALRVWRLATPTQPQGSQPRAEEATGL
ncbi:MAG: hypothetical protein ABR599_04700 [Gemmatimonadota bacterium]